MKFNTKSVVYLFTAVFIFVGASLFGYSHELSAQVSGTQTRVTFPNATQKWEFVRTDIPDGFSANVPIKVYRSQSDTGEVVRIKLELVDVPTGKVISRFDNQQFIDTYTSFVQTPLYKSWPEHYAEYVNANKSRGLYSEMKALSPGKTVSINFADAVLTMQNSGDGMMVPKSLLESQKKIRVILFMNNSRQDTIESEPFMVSLKKTVLQPNVPKLKAEYLSDATVKINIDLGICKKLCPPGVRVSRDGKWLNDFVMADVSEANRSFNTVATDVLRDLHLEIYDTNITPGITYNYEAAFISEDRVSLGASSKASVVIPTPLSKEPMFTESSLLLASPQKIANKIDYRIFNSDLSQATRLELWIKSVGKADMLALSISGSQVYSYVTPGLHSLEWNFVDPELYRYSTINYEIRAYTGNGTLLKTIKNKVAYTKFDKYIYAYSEVNGGLPSQKTTVVFPSNSKLKVGERLDLKFTAPSQYAYIQSASGEVGVVKVSFDPTKMQTASFVLPNKICLASDYSVTSYGENTLCNTWMNIVPGKYSVFGKVKANWLKGTADTFTVIAGQGVSYDTAAPSTPTSLTGKVVSSSEANISWGASTDNISVVGYKVSRDNVQVSTVNTTSYTDKNLKPQTSYVYSVRAYDAVGNTSQPSNMLTLVTPNVPTNTTNPTNPTNPSNPTPTVNPPVISSPQTVSCIQGVYCSVGLNGSGFTPSENVYWVGSGSNFTNMGKSNSYGGSFVRTDLLINIAPGTHQLYVTNANGTSNRINITVEAASVLPIVYSVSPSSGPKGTTVTITGKNFSTTGTNNWQFIGASTQILGSSPSSDGTHMTAKLNYSYNIPAGTVLKVFVDNDDFGFSDDNPEYKVNPVIFMITGGSGASATGKNSLSAGILEAITGFYNSRTR